jgi:hypothetical protein
VESVSPKEETKKKAGNYRGKDTEDWEWKDFQNYFDDQYVTIMGAKPPALAVREYGIAKSVIEAAYTHWGKQLLKDMIDWVFSNRNRYPQWVISMRLICGKHYWGNFIAEQTQKAAKYKLEYDEE